tara:strand:+ start:464 stop:742 length:279 start_codon:yes stop_codon:yes gene_type:complete
MDNKLPRPEVSIEEKMHETRVRFLNNQFPELDPLMCSVLLKCPQELMEKLKLDQSMWITPEAFSQSIIGNVSVSDAVSPEVSPRSVLETPFN